MTTRHRLSFGVGGRPRLGEAPPRPPTWERHRTLAQRRYVWHVAWRARAERDRRASWWPLDAAAYHVTVRHTPLADGDELRAALAEALTGVLWREGAAVAWRVVADRDAGADVGDGIMVAVEAIV